MQHERDLKYKVTAIAGSSCRLSLVFVLLLANSDSPRLRKSHPILDFGMCEDVQKSDRSHQELSNKHLVSKISVHTTENEPRKFGGDSIHFFNALVTQVQPRTYGAATDIAPSDRSRYHAEVPSLFVRASRRLLYRGSDIF